jgi:hypothetical protein
MLRRVAPVRIYVSEELSASVIRSTETSVLTRSARRNIREDALLHSHRRENLKCFMMSLPPFLHANVYVCMYMVTGQGVTCKLSRCIKFSSYFRVVLEWNGAGALLYSEYGDVLLKCDHLDSRRNGDFLWAVRPIRYFYTQFVVISTEEALVATASVV